MANRVEILGREEILGSYLPPLIKSGKFKRREGKGVWGKLARAATVPLSMLSQRGAMMNGSLDLEEIVGLEEILGGAFVGDDELALAAEGGSAERESLERRTGRRGRRGPPSPEKIKSIQARAAAGDERAKKRLGRLRAAGLVSGYNTHLEYESGDDVGREPSKNVAAERQMMCRIRTLKRLAQEGNQGAIKQLDRLRARGHAVGAAPVVDGLPHPTPLSAEQKEDLRTYLRHLPALDKTQAADHERMVAQLREKFGEVKERARAGDARSLARWNDIVKWTNKVQEGALRNDLNSLTHLRNISRTGIFNPRFRVAS